MGRMAVSRACTTSLPMLMLNSTFLLFIPAKAPTLKTILSYYSSTVTVSPEGDVHVSNETVEGLGKAHLFTALFGAVPRLFHPPKQPSSPPTTSSPSAHPPQTSTSSQASRETTFPWDPGEKQMALEEAEVFLLPLKQSPKQAGWLTSLLPPSGYFIAGGIAGAVSRTATAPLDRLKVYLIAQVGAKSDAVEAAKSGAPIKAARSATVSLVEASRTLWRLGGLQSLFAGKL